MKAIASLFGLLIVGFLMMLTLHACGVIGTVATAPGRVINKTLQTDNIITSYEWFFDANAQYQSRLAQAKDTSAQLKETTDPAEHSRLRIGQNGIRQSCRELATRYNANSEKMNKEIFKSKNLPVTLSITDCEN